MRKLCWSSILAAMLTLIVAAAANGQTPPGPTTVSTVSYGNVAIPINVEVVQEVLDFAPGAETTTQTRGGDLFVTVAEGEVFLRKGGAQFFYSAAARTRTFRVNKGEVYVLGNSNGVAKARLYTSTLLAPGAALITNVSDQADFPPAPTVVMTSRAAATPLPGTVTVVQVVWDFEPGAATPPHSHHGFFLVTVVDGQLARITPSGEKVYKTGEQFTEAPGPEEDAIVRNASPTRTRNFFIVLATQVPPSTTLPALGARAGGIVPPNTGEAGMSGQAAADLSQLEALLALTAVGTVGLLVLRTTRRKAKHS